MGTFEKRLDNFESENRITRQLVRALMKELGYDDYEIEGNTQGFICKLIKNAPKKDKEL